MARFFYFTTSHGESEVVDFLLRRYSNLDYIYKMPLSSFIQLFNYAKKEEAKEFIKEQWLMYLPYMAIGWLKSEPLSKFINKTMGGDVDTRPVDEIEAEIEKAKLRAKGGNLDDKSFI